MSLKMIMQVLVQNIYILVEDHKASLNAVPKIVILDCGEDMLEAKILYRSSEDNIRDSFSGGRFSSINYISNPSNNICQNSGIIVGHSPCNAGYSKVDDDSHSNTLNLNTVASRPKKRKDSTFPQSPWHKVYMQGSELCHSIRLFSQPCLLYINLIPHS